MKSAATDAANPHRLLQLLCLIAILAAGLLLRLGTALGTQVENPLRADAGQYVAYAWNLKFHAVYSTRIPTPSNNGVPPAPDALRPPAYPLLLRMLLPDELTSAFVDKVCYVQAWIAEATLLCATLLAMELVGAWAGLALGALVALSPHQSVYVGYLLTETFFGLALMLALAAGVCALKSRERRWRWTFAAAAGVFFALSCLIRPTLDQWVPVLVVLMLAWPPLRRFRAEIAVLALGFVLAMSPWWIRNEITLHRMSDPGKMITTLHDGSYPDFMYEGKRETFGYPYRFDPGSAQATSSWPGIYKDLKSKFGSHPAAMLRWYLFGKIGYFFGWSSAEGAGGIFLYPVLRSPWRWAPPFLLASAVIHVLYAALILAGLLGMLAAFLPATGRLFGGLRADGLRWLALLHGFAIGVHLVGAPFARYSVPFRPVTFTLAVFFILWLYRYYRELRREKRLAAISHG